VCVCIVWWCVCVGHYVIVEDIVAYGHVILSHYFHYFHCVVAIIFFIITFLHYYRFHAIVTKNTTTALHTSLQVTV
jgi:uncharacterized membrane protein